MKIPDIFSILYPSLVLGLAGKLGLGEAFNEPNESQSFVETLWRLMWLCLTLALNSIMLTIYTKSLSLAKNAAVASVLNTAANMVSDENWIYANALWTLLPQPYRIFFLEIFGVALSVFMP